MKKKGPLACDPPPVKSRHFCLKHKTYQYHGIDDSNVWVPSIITIIYDISSGEQYVKTFP